MGGRDKAEGTFQRKTTLAELVPQEQGLHEEDEPSEALGLQAESGAHVPGVPARCGGTDAPLLQDVL